MIDPGRPPFEIVRGLTVPPRDPKGTREGYTTGACAAAAAQAACLLLERDERPEVVAVPSPLGFDLMIPINRLAYADGTATAGVIKDGGDDPDVTHGAEVLATVRRVEEAGVRIRGGPGVGTVTQPGLELPPGSPAINPVPRRMIAEGVAIALGSDRPRPGVEVTVSVPGGEALARKTLNARIGILGGLSILGTTGVVRPMSTASWRASVVQSIDVAAANSLRHVVLTTGGRSERFAEALYPELPAMAFVQMGIFTGDSLRRRRRARGAAGLGLRDDRQGRQAGHRPDADPCGRWRGRRGLPGRAGARGGRDGRSRRGDRRRQHGEARRGADRCRQFPRVLPARRRSGRGGVQRPRRRPSRRGGRPVRLRRPGARPRLRPAAAERPP